MVLSLLKQKIKKCKSDLIVLGLVKVCENIKKYYIKNPIAIKYVLILILNLRGIDEWIFDVEELGSENLTKT